MKKLLITLLMLIVGSIAGYYYALSTKPLRPVLTTAGIVHICPENKIALIERGKEPKGLAMFGGHVENNEAPDTAFKRELLEELNIADIDNLQLIGVHGEPGRDPRQHSVEITYSCTTTQKPVAGSDAKAVTLYEIDEIRNIPEEKFAFDHGKILKTYLTKLSDCNPCKTLCTE